MDTNPGPRRPVPAVCRIPCSNVRDLAGNLSDMTVASSQYGILLCSETWSQICVSCVAFTGSLIWSPCRVVPGHDASGPRDGCMRTRLFRSISPTQI